MSTINKSTQERLSKSLYLYYDAMKNGNLKSLSTVMTKESYLITLDSIGFKRALKDKEFKKLLKSIETNQSSLDQVEEILSTDLADKESDSKIEVTKFEPNGSERITLHYSENGHPKKFYFSLKLNEWKIDYKAGRKID